MRFSLVTKVFLAFTIVIVTFLSVLVFSIVQTQETYSEIREINRIIVPLSFSLSDIQNDLKAFNIVLNEKDPQVLKTTIRVTRMGPSLPSRFNAKIEKSLAIFSKNIGQGTDVKNIESELIELKNLVADFTTQAQNLSGFITTTTDADIEIIDAKRVELSTLSQKIDDRLGALARSLRSMTDLALEKTKKQERSSLYTLAIATGIALFIAIFLVWILGKNLRPLVDLSAATKRIAGGDYQAVDTSKLGASEIATLGTEFNSMIQSLKDRDDEIGTQHKKLLKSERLATVGRMTAVITHELRNPLSSINLNSEMLMDIVSKSGETDAIPILDLIISEVDRLREITDNYLGYAKTTKAKMVEVDLGEILQKLTDFHEWEWEEMGVDVELKLSDGLNISGDKNQLRQAFLNLIKNGVEASKEGQRVEVSASNNNDTIEIKIRDHGHGISAENLKDLFEPFVTTKAQGTGLGLAVTQQIIEEHKGKIDVHTSNAGTTFTISLPKLS